VKIDFVSTQTRSFRHNLKKKTNESNFRVACEMELNEIGARLKNAVRKFLTYLQQRTGLYNFNFEICRVSEKEFKSVNVNIVRLRTQDKEFTFFFFLFSDMKVLLHGCHIFLQVDFLV
jgi:hypothetical protein